MNQTWLQQIDAYVSGTMSEAEKLPFDAALAENEKLASMLDIYLDIELDMRSFMHLQSSAIAIEKTLNGLDHRYFSRDRTSLPGRGSLEGVPATSPRPIIVVGETFAEDQPAERLDTIEPKPTQWLLWIFILIVVATVLYWYFKHKAS